MGVFEHLPTFTVLQSIIKVISIFKIKDEGKSDMKEEVEKL